MQVASDAPVGFASQTVGAFVAALGSSAPTPGGGAASALVGSLAVALVEMVAQLTAGRPKYQTADERAHAIITRAQEVRDALLAGMDADARAYEGVASA